MKSMSFAHQPQSEMNITPLVDVMLVLLIIFMLAIPRPSQNISTSLSQMAPQTNNTKPTIVRVSLDGQYYLRGLLIPSSALDLHLRLIHKTDPEALLEIDADNSAAYERVTHLLASAKNAGITRIRFAAL